MAGQTSRRDTQTLTVRIPKELHEAVRTVAFATDTSINDVVLHALVKHLSAEGHQKTIDSLLTKAQDKWRVALDKLADTQLP